MATRPGQIAYQLLLFRAVGSLFLFEIERDDIISENAIDFPSNCDADGSVGNNWAQEILFVFCLTYIYKTNDSRTKSGLGFLEPSLYQSH